RARGQLLAQVGSNRARQAGGESHVVHHARPFPIGTQRLNVRSDGVNTSLIRRVHARSREVVNISVQQQSQRTACIRFAQIQLQRMHLRESSEWQQLEPGDIFAVPVEQLR